MQVSRSKTLSRILLCLVILHSKTFSMEKEGNDNEEIRGHYSHPSCQQEGKNRDYETVIVSYGSGSRRKRQVTLPAPGEATPTSPFFQLRIHTGLIMKNDLII